MSRKWWGAWAAVIVVLAAGCGGSGGGDGGNDGSSGGADGPALSVAEQTVLDAFECFPTAAEQPREHAVLLVHGTGLTAAESWDDTYTAVLPQAGYNTCTIQLPNRSLDDIQVSSEYLVAAVRRIRRDFGGGVDLVGHSQGGLEVRWAIKWWPDVAETVDDAVMIATPNHGTATGDAVCAPPIPLAGCTEAVRQQTTTSNFIAAVNRGDETPDPVDYTSIYSTIADAIVPNLAEPYTSAVDGAANIAVQNLCPLRVVDHIGALTDPVVYALVRDALDNDGPAVAERVGDGACTALSPEGFSPVQAVIQESTYLPAGVAVGTTPSEQEPPLRDYAR